MKHRAVLFDTSDTLYRCPALDQELASAPVRFLAEKHGILEDSAKWVLKGALSKMKSEGLAPTKSGAIRRLGYSNAEFQDFIAATDADSFLSPNDSDLTALESLATQYTLGIVTNIGRSFLAKVLRALGMGEQLFTCVVTSDDVSEPKPHVEPFEKALTILGLPAQRCAYVGDNAEKDLVPAHAVSLRTVLVTDRPEEHLGEFYHPVSCLAALATLLHPEGEFWL